MFHQNTSMSSFKSENENEQDATNNLEEEIRNQIEVACFEVEFYISHGTTKFLDFIDMYSQWGISMSRRVEKNTAVVDGALLNAD